MCRMDSSCQRKEAFLRSQKILCRRLRSVRDSCWQITALDIGRRVRVWLFSTQISMALFARWRKRTCSQPCCCTHRRASPAGLASLRPASPQKKTEKTNVETTLLVQIVALLIIWGMKEVVSGGTNINRRCSCATKPPF